MRKQTITAEDRKRLHEAYYKYNTIELCSMFHVGSGRLREILSEEGLTGRMHKGSRKVEPVSSERCATCKSFSGRKGTLEGWCLKRKMRVRKRDFCSEHSYEQRGSYVI